MARPRRGKREGKFKFLPLPPRITRKTRDRGKGIPKKKEETATPCTRMTVSGPGFPDSLSTSRRHAGKRKHGQHADIKKQGDENV